MRIFIDFRKLETENSLLHIFSFLHKLSFENSFCFLPILSCQTSFLVSKIENCFEKQKIRGKTVTKHTLKFEKGLFYSFTAYVNGNCVEQHWRKCSFCLPCLLQAIWPANQFNAICFWSRLRKWCKAKEEKKRAV